jgi:hypothetical protein
MRIEEQPGRPPHRWSRRRLILLAAATLALGAVFVVVPLFREGTGGGGSPVTTNSGDAVGTTVPSTTIGARGEVLARLHQIFRVRDRAIQTRNASLLEGIYTVDCPCLKGDAQLIERLKRDNLIWQGIKVSLRVDSAARINDRLWTVTALVTTSPFEIIRESGEVIRRIPRGQELSRFALARPIGENEWLLGQASVIEKS